MANSEVQELIVKISAENAELKKKLQDSQKSMGAFSDEVKKMALNLAAAFSVTAIASFAKSAYSAFESAEKANRRLMFALDGNKAVYNDLIKLASKYREDAGISASEIKQIEQLAVNAGHSVAMVKKLTQAAIELSAVTGQDMQSAFMMLNMTFTGSAGRLGRLDSQFKEFTETELKAGAAVDYALKKYTGFAAASATETEKFESNWKKIKVTVGGALAEVINPLLNDLNKELTAVANNSLTASQKFEALFNADYARFANEAAKLAQAQKDAKIQAAANAWVQSDAGKKAIDLKTQEILKEMGFGKAAEQTAEQLKAQNKALEDQKKLWDEITSAQIRNAQAEGDKQMNSLNSQAAGWMLGDMGKMQPKGAKATGTLDATKLAKLTSGMKDLKTETSAVASEMREMAMAMASGETAASSFLSIINEGTTNLEDMGKSIYNSARSAIAAEMAQGIAATLRSVLVGVPFPLNLILAAGAGGAAGALFNNLVPKLAEGGIAYGTTSAIVGEYPGASHNPEVIAPLSKLRDVMGTQKVEVVGYIDGDVIRLANARSSYLRNRRG